jgi:exonuclease VII large subunit
MDHQKIYSQELDEKIKYLLNDPGNVWLKGEMENLKHTYVAKFSLNQS